MRFSCAALRSVTMRPRICIGASWWSAMQRMKNASVWGEGKTSLRPLSWPSDLFPGPLTSFLVLWPLSWLSDLFPVPLTSWLTVWHHDCPSDLLTDLLTSRLPQVHVHLGPAAFQESRGHCRLLAALGVWGEMSDRLLKDRLAADWRQHTFCSWRQCGNWCSHLCLFCTCVFIESL